MLSEVRGGQEHSSGSEGGLGTALAGSGGGGAGSSLAGALT
jgi:hypothetical protein